MPTRIYFSGSRGDEALAVSVEAEVAQVADAFNSAHGGPFRLASTDGGELYVNPANIAYWRESSSKEGITRASRDRWGE